jgi:ABC-type nickel/cobalt efflux system permease component RcnA
MRGVTLRSRAQSWLRRCVAVVMMAAAMAFTFETSFITTAATAADEDHHVEHEDAPDSSNGAHPKTHLVTHIHADGTVHRHAVDDDELADHLRESGSPCWSMAIVVGVLPSLSVCPLEAILIGKIAMEELDPYRGTEPDVPGRPPSTPSIA